MNCLPFCVERACLLLRFIPTALKNTLGTNSGAIAKRQPFTVWLPFLYLRAFRLTGQIQTMSYAKRQPESGHGYIALAKSS